MDFLNRCLRSRNLFLSAGLPDLRCFWKALSLCLAIRLSFLVDSRILFLVLEGFEGMNLFVREIRVDWRSSRSEEHTSDLHSTLTSLTNKFIPSKPSSTRNNLPWATKNSNGLLDKETELFQKHRKLGKPADRRKFLDLKHLFRKSIKRSYKSYHEDILDVALNCLTSKPNTKKSLHFSNSLNKILPLLHLYTNTILSIRTTPLKPLFLMNSSITVPVACWNLYLHSESKKTFFKLNHIRNTITLENYISLINTSLLQIWDHKCTR